MTSCATFLTEIIDNGLTFLSSVGGPQPTDDARRFLLAIAQQESGQALEARYQSSPGASPGPARGFWQFEQGGGVAGVLSHSSSSALASKVCASCIIVKQSSSVWRALEGHDLLATSFARLLILTHPKALPKTEQEGWSQYINLWRPGKPHIEVWPGNWSRADATVRQNPRVAQAGV